MTHGLGTLTILGLLFGWIVLTSYVLQRRRTSRLGVAPSSKGPT